MFFPIFVQIWKDSNFVLDLSQKNYKNVKKSQLDIEFKLALLY